MILAVCYQLKQLKKQPAKKKFTLRESQISLVRFHYHPQFTYMIFIYSGIFTCCYVMLCYVAFSAMLEGKCNERIKKFKKKVFNQKLSVEAKF